MAIARNGPEDDNAYTVRKRRKRRTRHGNETPRVIIARLHDLAFRNRNYGRVVMHARVYAQTRTQQLLGICERAFITLTNTSFVKKHAQFNIYKSLLTIFLLFFLSLLFLVRVLVLALRRYFLTVIILFSFGFFVFRLFIFLFRFNFKPSKVLRPTSS